MNQHDDISVHLSHRLTLCFAVVTVLLIPTVLLANSNGQFGRTSATGTGCGTVQCHGGTANTNTQVSFDGFSDSTTVAVGSTTEFTVVVSHETAAGAGVNIAAKTTLTGGTNVGVLAPTGSDLWLAGELTHTTAKQMQNGSARFTFRWTAPSTPGLYFLRAVANAVNLNGQPTGDQWNFAPVLRVRVSTTDGVHEMGQSDPLASVEISPVPAHESVTVNTLSTPGESYTISVFDFTGVTIFSDLVTSQGNNLQYVWNGVTASGMQAPPGPYVVAIAGDGTIKHARAVIVR